MGYRIGLFGDDNARIQAGYRALYQDYSSGSGNTKLKWDMTLHEPTLALAADFSGTVRADRSDLIEPCSTDLFQALKPVVRAIVADCPRAA